MRRIYVALAVALITVLLLAPAGASAAPATEFGDRCVANDTEAGWTAIGLNNGQGEPQLQPNAPPEGNWVITRWRIEVGPGAGSFQQRLVSFKQVAEEEDLRVGESALENVVEGVNEFPTRVPVPEYGHIGLQGPDQTYFCDKADGHLAGSVEGEFPAGQRRKFKISVGIGVPAIATIEPDRDNDGYGDVTQDRCPFLAWDQGPCPLLRISAGHAKVTRKAITISVSFESLEPAVTLPGPARVETSGEVLPAAKPHGGTGKAGIPLTGGVQEIPAGATTSFRLPLPKGVQRRLARMPHGKSLETTVRAVLTNAKELNGSGLQAAFAVKLRGRRKPDRHS